jgi:type II secretory pathway pseudopilin PulG
MGQNPMAQQISAAMQAHIAEHFGFQYRQKIEQQIGSPLPYEEDVDAKALPEDYEIQMSRLVAQASQQLLQQNQAQAAQQQAQQQAEDPMIQMAKQELVIKDKEVQRKALKDKQEVQIKQEQLNIEKQKLSLEDRKASAAAEANGFKLSSSAEEAKRRLEQDMTKFRAQQEADGIKTGLSVAEQLARPKPTKGE